MRSLTAGKLNPPKRARGPTHTRNFLKRIEIPAPRGEESVGKRVFGIRRRRACLGMPTDGGRW